MSDTEPDKTPEEQEKERERERSGAHSAFGVLRVRDDLVGVIRRPENAHLDRKPDDKPPEAA